MPTTSRSVRRAMPFVLAALALSGCGSDDPATNGSSPPGSEAATSTSSAATTTDQVGTAVDADAIVVQASSPEGDGAFLLASDGTVGRRLDLGDHSGKHPDWSPDGATVVFVDDNDGSLWSVGVDGSAPRQLLTCDEGCYYLDFPDFSPDGSRLAYTRYEPPVGDGPPSASSIRILDLVTGKSTKVTQSEQPELVDVARWSPDGTQLVIGIDRFDDALYEIGSTIAVVDAAGGPVRRLVDESTFAYSPDWGEKGIVFSVETRQYRRTPEPDDVLNLFLVQPDGSGLRTITAQKAGEQLIQPAWSSDGTSVLATLQTESVATRRIVAIDSSTGVVTQISTDLATHPRQRPDPSRST
jgi:Tol biopolymer transport system component